MTKTEIKWDATAETLQTVLTHLSPAALEYVMSEMGESDPEQLKILVAIRESDHLQDGW